MDSPWATVQHAVDTLMANYDFQCRWKVTIQLAVGSSSQPDIYDGFQVSGRLVGQCGSVAPLIVGRGYPPFQMGKYLPFTVRGDPANPLGAFFNPTLKQCVSMSDGAGLKIEGFTCDTYAAKVDGIDVFNGSLLDISTIWFGNSGQGPEGTPGFLHMGVAWNSTVIFSGQIWVAGSAQSFMQIAHSIVQENSDNGAPLIPITFMGGNFPSGVFIVDDSILYIYAFQFSGTVSGPKAVVMRNGVLFSNTGDGTAKSCFTRNPNFMPGSWNADTQILDNSVCQ